MTLWLVGLAIWFLLMGVMYGAEGIWFPALFMGYGIAIQWFGGETVGTLVGYGVITFWVGYISLQLGRFAWRKVHLSWFPSELPISPPNVDR